MRLGGFPRCHASPRDPTVPGMRTITALLLGAVLLLGATACGTTKAAAVPNVVGKRLDVAEDTLHASGLHYSEVGGGAFGIIVRSNWFVCEQRPRPRAKATRVTLYVERSCPPVRPPLLPYVVGQSLDDAEATLAAAGVKVTEENEDGDGAIVVESNWTVCDQWPEGGERSLTVDLYVSHSCW